VATAPTLHLEAARRTDLALVRAFVRGHAETTGLAPEAVDDLVQAVDEMATNVLVHGYRGRPGPLTVEVDAGTGELRVRLRDDAPPFDPRTWEPPDRVVPWGRRRPGGFGIPLSRGCVDEIDHRAAEADGAAGNELTLVKRGTRSEREPA
jgi:anti-sigma regulatory factor (Ser/Thr protein kinase)